MLDPIKVFVYGTLQRNQYAEDLMLASGGKFVSEAYTRDLYYMGSNGGFPGVSRPIKGKPAVRVKGELWEVEHLSRTDRYEGHPDLFRREEIEVILEDAPGPIKAWMYFYRGRPMQFDITSGDWASEAA